MPYFGRGWTMRGLIVVFELGLYRTQNVSEHS